jgi:cytochrome c-type biogenesis protein CcmH/NrfG
MRRRKPLVHVAAVVMALRASLLTVSAAAPVPSREEAYRANNLGVALLEQVKFTDAAEAFRRALKLDPGLDLAQVNLALALLNVPDLVAARIEAQKAVERAPGRLQAYYAVGLVAKAQNRPADAVAAFERVLKTDPDDVGANVSLAQLLMQQQKYADAAALLRKAGQVEPYNSTVAYALATALLRSGAQAEGQEQMRRFQVLREAGYATSLGQNYPQQGRYAEAIVSTGAEPGLVDARTPAVTFRAGPGSTLPLRKAAAKAAAPTHAALLDYDGDGDLDIFASGGGAAYLLRNDGGTFTDVTAGTAALSGATGGLAVAGDYDNDGREDLLAHAASRFRLYHNDGGGRFSDASLAAGVPATLADAQTAAFVDVDHDGDLDVLLAGVVGSARKPLPNVLLRNDGKGRFKDVAVEAKVAEPRDAVGVVPTDYDNHRDVDLLIARAAGRPALLRNLRDGSFKDAAALAGLELDGDIACVAAGDVNKDGYTDFFFGRPDGPGVLALSDGRERFTIAAAPEASAGAHAALFVDYDNDGLLDLVAATPRGLRVVRSLGERWIDVSAAALAPDLLAPKTDAESVRGLAAADLDGDGDTDLLLVTPAGLRVARNEGGERNAALHVALVGKGSNRGGVGAKVEARAGSLRAKLERYAAAPAPAPADLTFGLGARTAVDAIRILWPSGTLQAETELPALTKPPARAALRTVEELDRTPSSCPYLFAWNGERFAFVTDFMGGGEMGDWLAPGVYNRPDPEEYVRIGPSQLRERDGRYELRITHELEEVLYLDRLELLAVAHPADANVYPDEGLADPPKPFRLHAVRGARAPRAAVDEHGHDVLARVRDLDGRAVEDFAVLNVRGYAAEHAVTVDVGDAGPRPRLLLSGWTEYAFSSDNVAASQAGLTLAAPRVEARDSRGRWRTIAADIGMPVGRPQTIVVDLAGRLPKGAREVRVVTSMRVFWDQVRVADGGDTPTAIERLPVATAELRMRGFSAAIRRAGATTIDFDYDRVSTALPWKQMPGRYTRFGDVRPLLATSDDRFVVCHPGDEIALTFDARALPPLPAGWTRTFLLHADGFSKEMNLHSASPDVVAPLPFHGMSGYPYTLESAPSRSEDFLEYVEAYNTRVVSRTAPLLETLVAAPPEAPTQGQDMP